jgi:hypothetical protein
MRLRGGRHGQDANHDTSDSNNAQHRRDQQTSHDILLMTFSDFAAV